MTNEPIKPINLSLVDDERALDAGETGSSDQAGGHGDNADRSRQGKQPSDAGSLFDSKLIIAYCAIAFGFLGIFTSSIIFVPLCAICSLVALMQGHGSWAFVGLLLAGAGVISSPIFMGFLGFGTFGLWLMSAG